MSRSALFADRREAPRRIFKAPFCVFLFCLTAGGDALSEVGDFPHLHDCGMEPALSLRDRVVSNVLRRAASVLPAGLTSELLRARRAAWLALRWLSFLTFRGALYPRLLGLLPVSHVPGIPFPQGRRLAPRSLFSPINGPDEVQQ